jgi:hypothetical protein
MGSGGRRGIWAYSHEPHEAAEGTEERPDVAVCVDHDILEHVLLKRKLDARRVVANLRRERHIGGRVDVIEIVRNVCAPLPARRFS